MAKEDASSAGRELLFANAPPMAEIKKIDRFLTNDDGISWIGATVIIDLPDDRPDARSLIEVVAWVQRVPGRSLDAIEKDIFLEAFRNMQDAAKVLEERIGKYGDWNG
jgi:hypothetical protein